VSWRQCQQRQCPWRERLQTEAAAVESAIVEAPLFVVACFVTGECLTSWVQVCFNRIVGCILRDLEGPLTTVPQPVKFCRGGTTLLCPWVA